MRAVGQADRGRSSRHFLLRHHVLEIAEPQAAILFRHRDAVEAQRAHFRPQLDRKPILLIDPRRERRNTVGGEAGGCVADGVGHFAKLEIEPDIDHVCLLSPGALAEPQRFEQGG